MTAVRIGGTPRALAALLTGVLLIAGLTACTDPAMEAEPTGAVERSQETPRVRLTDNLDQRRAVPIDTQLRLTVENGSLQDVRVRAASGAVLTGRLGERGLVWTATGRLEPGTRYVVRATVEDLTGKSRRRTKRFRTVDLPLDRLTYASIAPLDGETVGVGMPVVVKFDVPVTDHAAMERHMEVRSTPRQPGSWHWLDDTQVRWRPQEYWQPGSEVTVDLDINSVPAGNGVFGQEDREITFHVGDAVIHRVDVDAHRMRTFINGDLARTVPISAGKEEFETRSGTKVIIEKHRYKTMDAATTGIQPGDPEYYNIEDVEYALRVTFSGEFLHAAPWSLGSQGSANVSHGCVGMSIPDARWVYEHTRRGDVVEVTGTDRYMTLENGWGDWNLSWQEYQAGSAL